MHPILIKIGPVTIHTYGFLLAVGVLCGIGISILLAKREKLDTKILADFLFYAILIGLVGAKLWYFVTELGYFLENPGEIPSLITTAGTFHGGIIFGMIFVIWYVRRHNLDFKVIGDVLLPGVALAHFFGRLGCFSAGCCWGKIAPEGCSYAVTFEDPGSSVNPGFLGKPLYPTQLMEAALNLLNFIILFLVFRKKKFNGQVFALYIFNYSIIRFFVEFYRGDDGRGYISFLHLSVPQFVSVIGFIAAVVLYWKFKKAAAETAGEEKKVRK